MPWRCCPTEVGSVAIWWGRISDLPADPSGSADQVELLDGVERERWERYRMPADRQRFALGVTITRTVLGAWLDQPPAAVTLDRSCVHCPADHGPPRLAGDHPVAVELSVAHSGDVVAVAFSDAPVGLDVELVDLAPGRHTGTATLALAPAELEEFVRLPSDEQALAFYATWSRKEAVLKASRDGLTLPLAGLVLDPARPGVRDWSARPELVDRLWITDLDHWPGYTAALATIDNPGPEVTWHAWGRR